MIPSPNLDDRTYQDILNEARRLIPRYCPEWTNHNPTDPGMTLVELFAWMTETTIYRLNKVPEKTYLTLLDLLGLSMIPPQPARTVVTFKTVEGYKKGVNIHKGVTVSTNRGGGDDNILFETETPAMLSSTKLIGAINKVGEDYLNITDDLLLSKGFDLFYGKNHVDRFLYLYSPDLKFLEEENALSLIFHVDHIITSVQEEVVSFLDWEYWDGSKWVFFVIHRSIAGEVKRDNRLFLKGPVDLQPTEVNGLEGYYVRASLREMPESQRAFDLNDVTMQLLFCGEGILPDKIVSNSSNMVFKDIDQSKDFNPFPGVPKYNDTFYFSCEEVLAKKGAEVSIVFNLSENSGNVSPDPSLVLKWEFWNGKSWYPLGHSTSEGSTDSENNDFEDSTGALTRSGRVRYKVPQTIMALDINGDIKHWLRIRIAAGDFGKNGRHVKNENGNWEWVFTNTALTPMLSRISLQFKLQPERPEAAFVYQDFCYENHVPFWKDNSEAKEKGQNPDTVKLFSINSDKIPYFYTAFDMPFTPGRVQIYFRMDEGERIKPSLTGHNKIVELQRGKSVGLRWQYWNGFEWCNLPVDDETDNFHKSGFCSFTVPEEWVKSSEFSLEGFWLRIALESGSFESLPRVLGVHLNSLYASNQKTYVKEILGSSSGSPNQVFSLMRGPVLPGLSLFVRENSIPPEVEKRKIEFEEGPGSIIVEESEDAMDSIWIKYHLVENFFGSTSQDRHFIMDFKKGTIHFGDGVKGVIPPRLKNNIMVREYRAGGGEEGNVTKGALSVLRESIPFITGVTNLYPGEGGAAHENIESLKYRAAGTLKSMNRAVTAEDYEWLAREASASVGRSHCLSRLGSGGEIIVVVIPRLPDGVSDFTRKLYPTPELIHRVSDYLKPRKLVGTKLRVDRPAYRTVSIKLNLILKRSVGEVERVRNDVLNLIRKSYHPLYGGDGRGWPFGQALTPSDLSNRLERIEAVQYVESIQLEDLKLGSLVEKVVCRDDELIFIEGIEINYRKYGQ